MVLRVANGPRPGLPRGSACSHGGVKASWPGKAENLRGCHGGRRIRGSIDRRPVHRWLSSRPATRPASNQGWHVQSRGVCLPSEPQAQGCGCHAVHTRGCQLHPGAHCCPDTEVHPAILGLAWGLLPHPWPRRGWPLEVSARDWQLTPLQPSHGPRGSFHRGSQESTRPSGLTPRRAPPPAPTRGQIPQVEGSVPSCDGSDRPQVGTSASGPLALRGVPAGSVHFGALGTPSWGSDHRAQVGSGWRLCPGRGREGRRLPRLCLPSACPCPPPLLSPHLGLVAAHATPNPPTAQQGPGFSELCARCPETQGQAARSVPAAQRASCRPVGAHAGLASARVLGGRTAILSVTCEKPP